MTAAIIVAGTDTNVGKTLVSAGLTMALDAVYWKPVQAGLDEETDSETVARLTGRPTLPEAFRLKLPASPHLAAAQEGLAIRLEDLALPSCERPLIVEGAGGVLAPLSATTLYADLMARWKAPVVLVARTSLGTINHTLLSLEALRRRNIPVAGVIFSGAAAPDSEATIARIGEIAALGRLPRLTPGKETLRAAFRAIDLAPVRRALAC